MSLHTPGARDAFIARVQSVTASSPRHWGGMSPDQMLWHLNRSLSGSLGLEASTPFKIPIPQWLMRFLALYLPWPKNSPTAPQFLPIGTYDLTHEKTVLVGLIQAVAAKPLDSEWGDHPAFGRMSGPQFSRLNALHLNHHLRQFGA